MFSQQKHIPLAELNRPTKFSQFIGQDHLRERLSKMSKLNALPSVLFFGPPGCGKSTIALILANSSGKKFVRISAPESGITNLRKIISNIDILILDEIHRYSKAQQDFFLPLIENGQLILIATTTENPSFSVTNQLLSRLHVLRFSPLTKQDLLTIGINNQKINQTKIPEKSLQILANISNGDARTFLNLLELVSSLNENELEPEYIHKYLPDIITTGDRNGDSHYELASALIKSIRGSNPDAALYYLACLLESGENPTFITRRLIISASEDIGLASPNALVLAVACHKSVEIVGMPESFIMMAQTVVYLALAPKSNSSYTGYLAAQKEIKTNGKKPVPLHLRNASTKLQRESGYGLEYKYPHAHPKGFVEQKYLPTELTGRKFYTPKHHGAELSLLAWLKKNNQPI